MTLSILLASSKYTKQNQLNRIRREDLKDAIQFAFIKSTSRILQKTLLVVVTVVIILLVMKTL